MMQTNPGYKWDYVMGSSAECLGGKHVGMCWTQVQRAQRYKWGDMLGPGTRGPEVQLGYMCGSRGPTADKLEGTPWVM